MVIPSDYENIELAVVTYFDEANNEKKQVNQTGHRLLQESG